LSIKLTKYKIFKPYAMIIVNSKINDLKKLIEQLVKVVKNEATNLYKEKYTS